MNEIDKALNEKELKLKFTLHFTLLVKYIS